ncbi:MAG: hypothetical protein ACREPB_14800 [Arenimonas sp.]
MKLTKTLIPTNSLLLVMDHSAGEIPSSIGDYLTVSTESCVAVGTLAEMDGETTVTLTDSIEGVELDELVFDGVLLTPEKEISVCDVGDEKLLTIPVSSCKTRVQIFANDMNEPDNIVVLVGQK